MMKIISLPISEGAILKPRSKFNFIAVEIEGKIGLLVFWGPSWAPCSFLAKIKERNEEDPGYQYMSNFPLFRNQIKQ